MHHPPHTFIEDANNICTNCGAQFDTPYCGQCGQQKSKRLQMGTMFKTALNQFLHFEGGLLSTIYHQFRKPGMVAGQYIKGRRKNWYNPIKYAFFSLTVYALSVNFFKLNLHPHGMNDPNQIKVFTFMFTYIQYAIFIVNIPLSWLMTKIFKGYNLTEIYILGLYTFAGFGWIHLLFGALDLVGKPGGFISMSLCDLLYTVVTICVFYGNRKAGTLFKGLLYFGLYRLCFMILGSIVIMIVGLGPTSA